VSIECSKLPTLKTAFSGKTLAGIPGDYGWQSIQYGTPEGHAFRAKLLRDCSRGGSMVEVGANIGHDTIEASDIYKTVYAFEPSETSFSILNHNVKLNNAKNVVTRKAALSNVCGRAKFFHAADGWSVCHSLSEAVVHVPVADHEMVDVLTLESALPTVTDCTLIQTDAEGNDVRVLQGAIPFIKRQKQCPVVVVEFAPKLWSQSGSNVDEFISFINTIGYNVFSDFGNNYSPVSHNLLCEMYNLWAGPCWAWVDLWLMPK
jgi:FkbM family methyltransferase